MAKLVQENVSKTILDKTTRLDSGNKKAGQDTYD